VFVNLKLLKNGAAVEPTTNVGHYVSWTRSCT